MAYCVCCCVALSLSLSISVGLFSFLEVFGATREELTRAASLANRSDAQPQTQSVIVNVTSLCGITPFETHGLYCMGKAAREMHHRVIAQEQLPCAPKVRVLQYSPGPMDTGMQTTIRESPAVFEGLSKKYGEMKANVRASAREREGVTSLGHVGLWLVGSPSVQIDRWLITSVLCALY